MFGKRKIGWCRSGKSWKFYNKGGQCLQKLEIKKSDEGVFCAVKIDDDAEESLATFADEISAVQYLNKLVLKTEKTSLQSEA